MLTALKNSLIRFLRPRLANSIRLKAFLYRLVWLLPEKYRDQNAVRSALKQLAAKHRTVRFLNIGANDGVSGDPLREFIITRKWQGLLVEPVDFVFARLQTAYANLPGVQCANVAIADHSGTIPFWFVRKNEVMPPGTDQLSSLSRDQIVKHADIFPGLESFVVSRDIPCSTVTDLQKKHGMQKLDLVFIDTEGFDYEVVKQLDLANNPPELIIYEEVHLPEADKTACRELLQKAGYSVQHDSYDGIATLIKPS